MAALLEGQSPAFVAREYSIPVGTVKGWKSKSKSVPEVPTQKKEEIGDLLLGYLQDNLRALRKQTELFSDLNWLRKQDAAELGTLHGIMTDKSIRLIEALNHAGQSGN